MSDGYPSMTALLGLLAVAGFQNRDKLAELLGGAGQATPAPAGTGVAPGGPGAGLVSGARRRVKVPGRGSARARGKKFNLRRRLAAE